MPIAGVLVTPVSRTEEVSIVTRLKAFPEVEVREVGPKGIAVVLEALSSQRLKEVSEVIKGWEEVVDLQLAYLNWEDAPDDGPMEK